MGNGQAAAACPAHTSCQALAQGHRKTWQPALSYRPVTAGMRCCKVKLSLSPASAISSWDNGEQLSSLDLPMWHKALKNTVIRYIFFSKKVCCVPFMFFLFLWRSFLFTKYYNTTFNAECFKPLALSLYANLAYQSTWFQQLQSWRITFTNAVQLSECWPCPLLLCFIALLLTATPHPILAVPSSVNSAAQQN